MAFLLPWFSEKRLWVVTEVETQDALAKMKIFALQQRGQEEKEVSAK